MMKGEFEMEMTPPPPFLEVKEVVGVMEVLGPKVLLECTQCERDCSEDGVMMLPCLCASCERSKRARSQSHKRDIDSARARLVAASTYWVIYSKIKFLFLTCAVVEGLVMITNGVLSPEIERQARFLVSFPVISLAWYMTTEFVHFVTRKPYISLTLYALLPLVGNVLGAILVGKLDLSRSTGQAVLFVHLAGLLDAIFIYECYIYSRWGAEVATPKGD